MQLSRTGAGRSVVALAITATLGAGLFAGLGTAQAVPTNPGPAPSNPGSVAPSNPSDQQLNNSDARKAALDQQVATLSGQIADAQAKLQKLQNDQELAEQKVALTVSRAQAAAARYEQSKQDLATAEKQQATMEQRFAEYIAGSYQAGTPTGMTGSLLTASDPGALLSTADYQQYAAEHSAGAVGQMQLATVRTSNVKAKSARAKAAAQKAQEDAQQAERQAAAAVRAQQDQAAGLQATEGQKQAELVTARQQQATLYGDRATYNQYVAAKAAYTQYQADLADYRAYQREMAARREAAARAAAAERAAERAAAKSGKKHHKKSSRSSSSSNDVPVYNPPAPSGGSWTQAKGNAAVKRAKHYLGRMYAWAGGNASGPTYGVCAGDGAYNDCNVKGFDCSGLVMYAWHANWDHYADTQYSQAGSYHPSRKRLKPGDLLFFGYRGGGSDLHHVAMYVGNGKMIEAPQSGVRIRISSIYRYSDYYGATRPLT